MDNDGGPAYPSMERLALLNKVDLPDAQKHLIYTQSCGMSLRDWFAGQFISSGLVFKDREIVLPMKMKDVASQAYELADALIAERNKNGT